MKKMMELSPETRANAMHNRFRSFVGYLRDALALEADDSFHLRLHYFRFLVSSSRFRDDVIAAALDFTQEGVEVVALIEAGLPAGPKSDEVLTSWMDGMTDADIRAQAEVLLTTLSAYLDKELLVVKESGMNESSSLSGTDKAPLRPSEKRKYPIPAKTIESVVNDESVNFMFLGLPFAIVTSAIMIVVFRHRRLSAKAATAKVKKSDNK